VTAALRPRKRPPVKHLISLAFAVGVVVVSAAGCSGCEPTPADGAPDDAGVVDCVAGTVDCECAANDVCGDDLVCTADVCVACVFGTIGCPCAADGCGVDVCDVDTDRCREASACEKAGCAQHRLCEQEPGADAVCLDACEPGYEFDVDACLPVPSCTVGDPGFCGANRACVEGGVDGDVCGACDGGFVDAGGECVDNSCAGLRCEAREHRSCVDGEAGPACADCLEGYVEEAGVCVALVTCESLNCQAPLQCVFETGSDEPVCQQPAVCPLQQVQNSSGTCVACTACFQNGAPKEGVVGVGNGSLAFGSSCICELQDNFFQGVDGVVRSCDADGDGWVNSRLITSLRLDGNANNPFAAGSRCHVREIDRFELRGDDFRPEFAAVTTYNVTGQRTVPISALNLGIATAKLYEPEETDDPTAFGLRYKQQGTPPEKLLRSYGLTAPDNTFTDGVAGHLRAAEVNPLTKACNHDSDDINLDGITDVTQLHGAFPVGTTGFGPDAAPAAAVFYKFAHFIELARGSFRDRAGAGLGNCNGALPCFGAYVIEEKHRAAGAAEGLLLELTYGADADAQWQTCQRSRDVDYPGAVSNVGHNSDFAEWSEGCETSSGGCFVGAGRATHVPYDGRPFEANRTVGGVVGELGATGAPRFVGMNHASQFKCVSFGTQTVTPARRKPAEDAVFNDCRLEPRRSDPAIGPEANPADPFIDCVTTTPEPTGNAAASRNFFVAIEHEAYTEAGDYTRGCISEGAEWGDQVCVVDANSVADDQFGALFCGCGDNRAGLDCEISCAPQHVLQNRTANGTTGDIEGFFTCMVPVGSSGETLSGGGFTLRGAVPAASGPTGVHTGGGFTLTPGGTP